MTTGNNIIVDVVKNVLSIPLECIHTDEKKNSYVFVADKFKVEKRQIKTGKTNENFAIVEAGLNEGERLLLSAPENADEMDMIALEKK